MENYLLSDTGVQLPVTSVTTQGQAWTPVFSVSLNEALKAYKKEYKWKITLLCLQQKGKARLYFHCMCLSVNSLINTKV